MNKTTPRVIQHPLLHCDQAQLALPSGTSLKNAFGPFNFCIYPGERIAILGPSGAGKSTLLALMSGSLSPQKGEVRLNGHLLDKFSPSVLSQHRAVLPQSHTVMFNLPVELVVGLGRVSRQVDDNLDDIVQAALALARAGHLRQRCTDSLSGGELARVHIARVFAQLWDIRNGMLLVDEPLASLDPGLQLELMDSIQDFVASRGHALIAVLHDVNQAVLQFDRLLLIKNGQLSADHKVTAAVIAPLEDLYQIKLEHLRTSDGALAVVVRRALYE